MITFNNIADTIRTPIVATEIDNSRALQGLYPNPHKVLMIGQKHSSKSATATNTVFQITRDGLADGYFGSGSILARMCNIFKDNNPNTELHAMCVDSAGGVAASGTINFSNALRATAEASVAGTYYLMINGTPLYMDIAISASGAALASILTSIINANSNLPVHASFTLGICSIAAVCSGTQGNYIDIRANYYAGQSLAACFSAAPVIVPLANGSADPYISSAWAVIDGEQYQYVCQPYTDTTSLTSIETELESRFGPLVDKQGHGFVGYRGALASCTTIGNSRNKAFNTIMGAYDSPTTPEEWGAALCAVAADKLNEDPARPLQFLTLKGVLAPPQANRFTRAERDIMLYDGIATWITDSVGNVMIERCITTYQTNAVGLSDPSYLDVETLATLNEIRYQYKARMVSRFLIPRFKLVDDTFPIQPGSYVVNPKTIKQEIVALFSELQDVGLIENIDDFIKNLLVERSSSDRNRVNVLLPPDLVNQFRVLAGVIQFIL